QPGKEVCGRAQVDVDVAAGGDERAVLVDEEGAVELCQLLDRFPEIGPFGVEELRLVAVEWVEEELTGLGEDVVHVADDEERPYLAALAALAGELDGQLDDRLERLLARAEAVRALGHRPEGRAEPLLPAVGRHC